MSKYFTPSSTTYFKSVKPLNDVDSLDLIKLAQGPEPREDGEQWDSEQEGVKGFPLDFVWDFDKGVLTKSPKKDSALKKLTVDLLKEFTSVLDQGEKITYNYSYPPIGEINPSLSGVIPQPFSKGVYCIHCGTLGRYK